MFILSIQTVTKLIVMVFIGYLGARLGILTNERTNAITQYLTQISLPCMLLAIGFTSYSPDKASTILYGLIATCFAEGFCALLSILFIKKKDNPECHVERGACYALNAGFVGGAIITSMMGSGSFFYSAGSQIAANIFTWVIMFWMISGEVNMAGFKKAWLSKTMISLAIGLVLFFLPITLPAPLTSAIDTVGSTSGPIALIIAGTGLYGLDIKKVLKRKNAYIGFVIKLLVCPLILIPFFKIFPSIPEEMLATFICCSCSCPAVLPVFALNYGHDHKYASALLAIGLVLCMLTLPLTVAIYEAVIL